MATAVVVTKRWIGLWRLSWMVVPWVAWVVVMIISMFLKRCLHVPLHF